MIRQEKQFRCRILYIIVFSSKFGRGDAMARRSKFLQRYKIAPIIITSLLVFIIISCAAILIWSTIVFLGKAEVSDSPALPAIAWLLSLFLATGLMTLLTKGGTVFPALFLGLITVVLSCLLGSAEILTVGGFILKLILSLIAAIAGFTLVKLYLLLGGKLTAPQRKMPIERKDVSDILNDIDFFSVSEDEGDNDEQKGEEYPGFREYHR
jgi:hypothetical protein